MLRSILKWSALVLLVVAIVGFGTFLFVIPPYFITSPEKLARPIIDAAPSTAGIADPAERAMAERGRYLVVTGGCMGCHQTPTPQGPDLEKYLAGGMRFQTRDGAFVTRNLTPEKDTGLAHRSDDEVKRVLRSGVFPDGHVVSYRLMPWSGYTYWTAEDAHAVVVYLRHVKAVRHQIPDAAPPAPLAPGAIEEAYRGRDYGQGR
ncbi:MAG: hypothetical protein ACHQO8_12580 [Vicinamibacterales bacterium]